MRLRAALIAIVLISITLPFAVHAISPLQPSLVNSILSLGRAAAVSGYGGEQALAEIDARVYAMKLVRGGFLFLGLGFIIYLIYGGATWMMSGGNTETIGKAKKILLSASIGLIIMLLSYSIAYAVSRSIQQATFRSMFNAVQNCSTASGQATCCNEWSAFQNKITTFQSGVVGSAHSWDEVGQAFGEAYGRCAGTGNPTAAQALPDECGGREYRQWSDCWRNQTNAVGLDNNLFD